MTKRAASALGSILILVAAAPTAFGYIHFPPMTLPKMCKQSHHIRFLKIEKASREKGVIVFEATESAKGGKSAITSFKHVIPTDAPGAKPILDWIADGKTAVMFSIEIDSLRGIAYVFIDDYCYSVDYNQKDKHWLLIRGEPDMSACYHGSIEQLQKLIKDVLEGKEVKVPVKEPEKKEDADQRMNEINEVLKKNRQE
jgi:hypothetical protein